MIIRLRSRDGLERITVPDGAGVAALKAAIQSQLGVEPADMSLSKDAALLTAKGGLDGIRCGRGRAAGRRQPPHGGSCGAGVRILSLRPSGCLRLGDRRGVS
jgi:hypothetical protein